MSNNEHVGELITGWRKRQITLDIKADNARELGFDYEPDKTVLEMAREAGFNLEHGFLLRVTGIDEDLERFAALVRADERKKFLGALRQLHDSYSLQSDPSGLRARGQA
jgi:hypothetical protein